MISASERGGQEVVGAARIEGPIVVVEGVTGIGYDEMAEVVDRQGRIRRGRVLEVGERFAVVEVFAGTTGLTIADTSVRFVGEPALGLYVEHVTLKGLAFKHGQYTLPFTGRCQRMTRQETGQHRQRITGTRVVLHGTGTQRIKFGINGKVFLR